MRVLFIPSGEKVWADYYSNQALQKGGYVAALPFQRAAGLGSLFKGLFRAVLPVARSVAKSVGKQALSTGAAIASDVVAGKSIESAAKRRGKAAAAKLLTKAAKTAKKKKRQAGGALGVRAVKKYKNSPKKYKKNQTSKKKDV